MISLADAHLHLQDPRLEPHLAVCLDAARAQGVCGFVCNGTQPDDWDKVASTHTEHPDVLPAFGVHPWFVRTPTETWLPRLEALLEEYPCASVGETGLDRWITPRNEEFQEAVFVAQLDLATRLQRPLTIHCLKAWEWLMRILSARDAFPPVMVLHAFGGSAECLRSLLRWPVYFSFCGGIAYDRYTKMKDALRACPPERLLLETDAPDFPLPDAEEGRPPSKDTLNMPTALPRIAQIAAHIRNEPVDDLAHRTLTNWRAVFQ